jgi:hypothetical protein
MVHAEEVFGVESLEEPDTGFRERLLSHLADPGTIYIFHSPEETILKRWEPFQALVAEEEKGIQVEKGRESRRQRFGGAHLTCNADKVPGEVREYCRLDDGGEEPTQVGDATVTDECQGISSHVEVGSHHSRPGWGRRSPPLIWRRLFNIGPEGRCEGG